MGRLIEKLFAPLRWFCAFGLANAAAWVAWLIRTADPAEMGQNMVRSAIAALFAVGAVGLARNVRWGYRAALASIWLLVFAWLGMIVPIVDSPGHNPVEKAFGGLPPTYVIVAVVLAGVIALFTVYFVLQTNKDRFRSAWW